MKNFDSFEFNQENKLFHSHNSYWDNLSNYRKTGGPTILTGTVYYYDKIKKIKFVKVVRSRKLDLRKK